VLGAADYPACTTLRFSRATRGNRFPLKQQGVPCQLGRRSYTQENSETPTNAPQAFSLSSRRVVVASPPNLFLIQF
jgi:hypothetical protein